MEYREDMMFNLEKSPGMCLDRPEITPKSLDLVVSPTCVREKKRELLWVWSRFGGRRECEDHRGVRP